MNFTQEEHIGTLSGPGVEKRHTDLLQRPCTWCEHAGSGGECETCKSRKIGLQRSALDRNTPDVGPPIVSQERMHTDPVASESVRAVHALANTVGSDVVFRKGQYAPMSRSGIRLLGHELTDVLQQPQTGALPDAPSISHPQDAAEQEAGRASRTITGNAGAPQITQSASSNTLYRVESSEQPTIAALRSSASDQAAARTDQIRQIIYNHTSYAEEENFVHLQQLTHQPDIHRTRRTPEGRQVSEDLRDVDYIQEQVGQNVAILRRLGLPQRTLHTLIRNIYRRTAALYDQRIAALPTGSNERQLMERNKELALPILRMAVQ